MNTFKRNLMVAYGLSLLLLIISAVASYVSIRNLLSNTDEVNHTNEVIKSLDGLLLAVKDGESGQRGYMLTNDKSFLLPYTGSFDRAQKQLQEVRTLTLDNAVHRSSVDSLSKLVTERFQILQAVIDEYQARNTLNPVLLDAGKRTMESIRLMITRMQETEKQLLAAKTSKMNQFAVATPALIIIASVLSILITVSSYIRVNEDRKKQIKLLASLEEKDHEVTNRIHIIENIADRISSGDYKARVEAKDNDLLGTLGIALNKMAKSLEDSFSSLAEQEWQGTGIGHLNDKMIGENDVNALAIKTINFLTEYTDATAGAFYLNTDKQLTLAANSGLDAASLQQHVNHGESLVGQAAQSGKVILLNDIPQDSISMGFSGGKIVPAAIVAIPVYHETKLKAVMEFISPKPFNQATLKYLKAAAFNIGMAIHSARDHQRLQTLLAETKAQARELETQQRELENINAELEAQAEKLQASEEELRVQQEELQQANQELEERSRLLEEKNELILERNLRIQAKAEELALSTKYKSEFLANMSHELRTPLNSILLLSRLLAENHGDRLSQDQIEYAEVIQSSGKGLLALIDDILDLSKIESGKMELQFTEVKLQQVMDDTRAMFAPIAKEKGLNMKITREDDVPVYIEVDHQRLDQVLRNLISNALKFTRRGTVELNISKQDGSIVFSVIDSGIGIPKDKQQIIFEAFQQADGSTRRQFGGTGLGLSISRELAKLMGGDILLESEEGKGSRFSLMLPLDRNVIAADTALLNEPLAFNDVPASTVPSSLHNGNREYLSEVIPEAIPDDRSKIVDGDRSILIVEDDTAFAKSLLDYTRRNGYKGIVSVRGDEAIELAKQFQPTGILLDLQLPVKSGWEVMDELKANPKTRSIPVHMMSSHQVKTKSLTKGAVDFIEKPVAFEALSEVFSKIEKALSNHPRKVLIVEENTKHAEALAFFLQTYDVRSEIRSDIEQGIEALNNESIECVILDMGFMGQRSFDFLEDVKKTQGLENVPIIVFTGKNLSSVEEKKIRQYADSIVVKTAQSYQRILDEVSLFLHLVEQNSSVRTSKYKNLGIVSEVLKGKSVLVADDDVRNIFSLTRSLESYGMNVISAIDGKDALKQLTEHEKIDLVLMDMMMPEMDGYESIRKIREKPEYRQLPIIAVTAKAMSGDREKCIEAGASDYITKPVDLDQLVSLLRVWLY